MRRQVPGRRLAPRTDPRVGSWGASTALAEMIRPSYALYVEASSGNYTEATSGLQLGFLGEKVTSIDTPTGPASPAGTERAMRADARRNYEKLLAAASAAFAEHGADDVSLEEIAKRAGVGIGTLYRHFPTRQSLLETIYRDQVDSLGALAERLRDSRSPEEALTEWMRALVDFTRTKRTLSAALSASLGNDSELLSVCKTILRESTDSLLKTAQQAGLARADLTAGDFMRLSHSIRVAADLAPDDPDQAERMLDVVVAGILTSPRP